jgi:hypothetical protein
MTMKKLIIAAAAFAALSAPAFAQSVNDGRSLHSPVDYASLQASQDGTPIGLKIIEAEQLYDQYND